MKQYRKNVYQFISVAFAGLLFVDHMYDSSPIDKLSLEVKQRMVYRDVKFVPAFYKIFDEILVNAADLTRTALGNRWCTECNSIGHKLPHNRKE